MRSSKITIALLHVTSWEGGRLYTENLGRALAQLPEQERPRLLWFAHQQHSVHPEIRAFAELRTYTGTPFLRGTLGERVARARGLLRLAALDADFIYPSPLLSLGRAKTGFWIPDFQHRHLPENFSSESIAQRNVQMRRGARRASVVVLSSADAQADFRAMLPEFAHKSRILHFSTPLTGEELTAIREADKAPELAQLPPKYIYLPNQFWKHKAHDVAFRALAKLGGDITLVCTGKMADDRNFSWITELQELIETLGLSSRVILLGYLPRHVQLRVMERASLILQPSRFEGWSTVVEDARALHKPIVLSDLPVHLEQAPPQALYFPRDDVNALADTIEKALNQEGTFLKDEELQHAARERLLHVGRTLLRLAEEVS